MNRYLRSNWFRVGLALVIFGWGPLWGIVALAAIGVWPDPNPNPIGPGLLFFVTAWPAVICLAIGVMRARRGGHKDAHPPHAGARPVSRRPAA